MCVQGLLDRLLELQLAVDSLELLPKRSLLVHFVGCGVLHAAHTAHAVFEAAACRVESVSATA